MNLPKSVCKDYLKALTLDLIAKNVQNLFYGSDVQRKKDTTLLTQFSAPQAK